MTMTTTLRSLLLAGVSVSIIGFASPAGAALTETQAGNVTYVTGGIGSDERTALEAQKRQYNFTMLSANTKGELTGDTQVIIRDSAGNEVLNTTAGPLLFANLPDGTYTLEATNEGQVKTQKIFVRGGKQSHVHLSWN